MTKLGLMIVFLMAATASVVGAYDVLLGAYYGLEGDNLPPPWKVVVLCRKYNISRVRLSEPNLDVIDAFRGFEIDLSFGVSNSMLTMMATNNSVVDEWFKTYVEPFVGDFTINYIIVGHNIVPGPDDCVLPVMKSLQDLLNKNYLGQVKVTTLVDYKSVLSVKYPPSSATFDPTIAEYMKGILQFLSKQGSPLMISLHPYETYISSNDISLSYATFTEQNVVVRDGMFSYNNLFDQMVDAFYAAIDKEEMGDVAIAVGETGWPTCGNYLNITTPSIAATYNNNFMNHISSGKGTPRKPNVYIEGFVKSLFNENQKAEGEESHCYGVFNVLDSTPLYSLF